MIDRISRSLALLLACSLTVGLASCGVRLISDTSDVAPKGDIQHIVVIFQENVSFDHLRKRATAPFL
jgi:phospholipase C